jgi:outer membrane protein TolC
VERAGRGVDQAQLDTELFDVRWEVDDAFFQALFLQERLKETSLMIEDLGARLEEARAGVAAGTVLSGDASLLEAELLTVRQQERSLQASRRAALGILERLTRRSFGDEVVMAEPRLAARLEPIVPVLSTMVVDLPDTLRRHPRFAVFEQREHELDQRIALVESGAMPILSAFGDASYANPGLRLFDDTFKGEWLVGLKLRWTPWDWDDRSHQIDELRVQVLKLDVERRSFEQALVRTLQPWLQGLQRLQDALATDESIIALREAVVDQARAQYAERAIPASRYVDARTELSRARVNQTVHRAELSQTRAAILLTLGMEID